MTRANSLQPPRLATWLLDQFSPVLQNAPLAGDLMEAFKQRRSSSWYWRQVFGAILIALPSLLRKQWGCLAYAVGCSGLISPAWFFMIPTAGHGSALPQVFALYARGFAVQWPWSLVYQIVFLTAFQFVIVAVALSPFGVLVHAEHPSVLTEWLSAIGRLLALAALSYVIARAVFAPGRVTLHRVQGAIVLYMNFALFFFVIYRLMAALLPKVFSGPGLPPTGAEHGSGSRAGGVSDRARLS